MADPRLRPEQRRAIENAALRTLSREQKGTASLFIDDRVIRQGQDLGLPSEAMRSRQPLATLVFVDFHPRKDFAHACRYLFFDPATANLLDSWGARFPPYPLGWPPNYERFDKHRPLHAPFRESEPGTPQGVVNPPPGPGLSAPVQGAGLKFAILFAGIPDPAHLNTMEFAYRVLVARGFPAANIFVASYGAETTPMCQKWKNTNAVHNWAGNWTPTGPVPGKGFEMKVNWRGDRNGFKKALEKFQSPHPPLGPGDLLFIYTTGHGEGGAGKNSVFLRTMTGNYTTRQFKNDLQLLKDPQGTTQLGQLVVLMAQCSSGGFKQSVLDSGAATNIAFMSAADWNTAANQDGDNDQDTTWSYFPSDWFATQVAADHDSMSIAQNGFSQQFAGAGSAPSVGMAFAYAADTPPKHPEDTPCKGFEPQTADQLLL